MSERTETYEQIHRSGWQNGDYAVVEVRRISNGFLAGLTKTGGGCPVEIFFPDYGSLSEWLKNGFDSGFVYTTRMK